MMLWIMRELINPSPHDRQSSNPTVQLTSTSGLAAQSMFYASVGAWVIDVSIYPKHHYIFYQKCICFVYMIRWLR